MDKQQNMNGKNRNSEFLGLLTPNYYKIHSFILTMVSNKTDAEDVLQSSISYMLEHFDDFKPGTNFLSWAFTISKYHVLTHRKKHQRSKIQFSEKAIELIESENKKLSKEIDVRYDALGICMKKLSFADLTLIKKRFEKGVFVKDLASEIGVSINVAYKRLSKIKILLLKCIERALAAREVL